MPNLKKGRLQLAVYTSFFMQGKTWRGEPYSFKCGVLHYEITFMVEKGVCG